MDYNQVLLVEGNDDLHVISALCCQFGIKETFKIEDCKGVDRILNGLPVRLKGSGDIKTIGIVVDADVDMERRWLAVRRILVDSGRYDAVPDVCPNGGLILKPRIADDIKVGVWIMPDNRTNGMLENFVAFLVPEEDDLMPVVDETLAGIESRKLNRYSIVHHDKARIHTWLAWQESPGTPMGMAVTKKYLTTTPAICQDFVDWLNLLFNED